jgi:cyclopropane fatty-acyl-phospholipid synthase-like methyltransferase
LTTSEHEQWNQVTQELETHYREEKDALRRAIDKVFRKAVSERQYLTLKECKNINGKNILEIGCGTGRMAIQLAKRGAYVVGVDSSESMIKKANTIVEKEDLLGKCTFIQDDFAKHSFNEKFDISIALGFFDYARYPEFYMRKMRSVTREKCIISFSARFAFQVPLRIMWVHRSAPIYFYTKKELKRLFSPNFTHYTIKNISAGYHCVGVV